MPDSRDPRGVRRTLASVLLVSVAAVLAGAQSLAAIGEWVADAPPGVLAALGVRFDPLAGRFRPPGEAAIRRVLSRLTPAVSTQSLRPGWLARLLSRGGARWRWTAAPCAAPGTAQ